MSRTSYRIFAELTYVTLKGESLAYFFIFARVRLYLVTRLMMGYSEFHAGGGFLRFFRASIPTVMYCLTVYICTNMVNASLFVDR